MIQLVQGWAWFVKQWWSLSCNHIARYYATYVCLIFKLFESLTLPIQVCNKCFSYVRVWLNFSCKNNKYYYKCANPLFVCRVSGVIFYTEHSNRKVYKDTYTYYTFGFTM